ncbi:Uncharacterised protein [Mycobacteroides abscessus subsp. abscessus]|nr:Uncharacterised protein [Mycobacteroides abscessus subsp. abscessus]
MANAPAICSGLYFLTNNASTSARSLLQRFSLPVLGRRARSSLRARAMLAR